MIPKYNEMYQPFLNLVSDSKEHAVREIRQLLSDKYALTEEEKLAYKRSQYPKLTRYQFMRGMLEYGYKSSDIEAQIMRIEDEYTRELTLLGFREATNFVRTDSSVLKMQSVLGLSDEKVDELWEYALQL